MTNFVDETIYVQELKVGDRIWQRSGYMECMDIETDSEADGAEGLYCVTLVEIGLPPGGEVRVNWMRPNDQVVRLVPAGKHQGSRLVEMPQVICEVMPVVLDLAVQNQLAHAMAGMLRGEAADPTGPDAVQKKSLAAVALWYSKVAQDFEREGSK